MEEKDDTGMTPLLAAIERGNQDAAALLLIHGADIDAIDGGGRGVMDLPQCHHLPQCLDYVKGKSFFSPYYDTRYEV